MNWKKRLKWRRRFRSISSSGYEKVLKTQSLRYIHANNCSWRNFECLNLKSMEGEEVLLSMWTRAQINVTCKRFQHPWCKRASSRRAARVKPKLQLLAQLPLISMDLSDCCPCSLRLLKKEFRNPLGTDKKQNMFHNPFFVDLAEGPETHPLRSQHLFQLEILNMLKCWSLNKVCPGSQSAESTCVGNWRCQLFSIAFLSNPKLGANVQNKIPGTVIGFVTFPKKDECHMGYPRRVRKNRWGEDLWMIGLTTAKRCF